MKMRGFISSYNELGGVILTTAGLASGAGVAVAYLRHRQVPAWIPIVVGAGLLLVAMLAFLVGRRSWHRLKPEAAERARHELQVARAYLRNIVDFMYELRTSLSADEPADVAVRLEQLRELVFIAIAQGINTRPGEFIRCAMFEPVEEDGDTVFRVVHHHGHTSRVQELRLHRTSVAGRAFLEEQPIYIADAGVNEQVERTQAGRAVESLLCLPAYGFAPTAARANIVGVFSVASNVPDAFSPSDQRFISACADLLGLIASFIGIMRQIDEMEDAEVIEYEPPVLPVPDPAEEEDG